MWAAFFDVAVDLVGADLQEQWTLERLLEADQLEQVLHAHEVGQAEFLVAADRPVDVALRREIKDEIAFGKILERLNFVLNEPIVRVFFEELLLLESAA